MDNHFEKEMLGFLDKQIAAKEKELEALKKANSDLTEEQYESLPEYLKLIKELNELYRLQRVKKMENTSSAVGKISETPSIDNDFSDDLNWLNKEIQSAEEFYEQLDRNKISTLAILDQYLSEGRSFFESLVKEEQNNFSSDFSDLSGKFDEFKNEYCKEIAAVQKQLKDYQEELKANKECLKSNKKLLYEFELKEELEDESEELEDYDDERAKAEELWSSKWSHKFSYELYGIQNWLEKKQMELRRLRFGYWDDIISWYDSSFKKSYRYKFVFDNSDRLFSLGLSIYVIKSDLYEKEKEWEKGEDWVKWSDWREKFNSLSDYFSQIKDSLENFHEITKKCDDRLKEYDDRLDEVIKKLREISTVNSEINSIFDASKAKLREIFDELTVKPFKDKNSFGTGFWYPFREILILLYPFFFGIGIFLVAGLLLILVAKGLELIGFEHIANLNSDVFLAPITVPLVVYIMCIFPIILLAIAFYVFIKLVNEKKWATLIGFYVGWNIFFSIVGWLYFRNS